MQLSADVKYIRTVDWTEELQFVRGHDGDEDAGSAACGIESKGVRDAR